MSLKGRVALITGGAGHIGSAMAEALAETGATVILNDMVQDRCDQKAQEINRKYPGRAHGLAADVGDEKGCRDLVARVAKEFGGLNSDSLRGFGWYDAAQGLGSPTSRAEL